MAKLAIIFGAGASYDFLPTYGASASSDMLREIRIPLADHLFENRPGFAEIAKKHRRLLPLIQELRNRGTKSVEQALEELRSIDKKHRYWPSRQRELMAVRFYLQAAIWSAQEAMLQKADGLSNYAGLLRNIQEFRRSDEPVVLITFNYDTLLEQALSLVLDNYTFNSIGDYVRRQEYKLFKLHGSLSWGNPIMEDARIDVSGAADDIKESIIELGESFDYDIEEFSVWDRPKVVDRGLACLPAISIPVQTKSHFSCPKEWLSQLDQLLVGVTNVLVIGWSAGEDHFLKRAVPVLNGNPDLKLTIVSAGDGSARYTQTRLEAAGLKPERTRFETGGFTNFMSGAVKVFLRRDDNVV